MRFWDSSAVIPLLLEEPMSARVEAVLHEDREVVLWWATPVECASGVARSHRENRMSFATAQAALGRLDVLIAGVFEIEPVEDLRLRARRLLRIHPLRAADAFQLASALLWCSEITAGAAFVCLDKRLSEAAAREGFEVLPV